MGKAGRSSSLRVDIRNLRAAGQNPASSFASCLLRPKPPSRLPPALTTKVGPRGMTSSLCIRARHLGVHFWKHSLCPQASESPSAQSRQQETGEFSERREGRRLPETPGNGVSVRVHVSCVRACVGVYSTCLDTPAQSKAHSLLWVCTAVSVQGSRGAPWVWNVWEPAGLCAQVCACALCASQ